MARELNARTGTKENNPIRNDMGIIQMGVNVGASTSGGIGASRHDNDPIANYPISKKIC